MSMEGIDFTFREHPDKPVHIEVKEKKSRYDTREWPLDDMDEKDAFILDDLTSESVWSVVHDASYWSGIILPRNILSFQSSTWRLCLANGSTGRFTVTR